MNLNQDNVLSVCWFLYKHNHNLCMFHTNWSFLTNKVFKLVHTNSCDLTIIQFHKKAKHSLNFIDGFCMTFSFCKVKSSQEKKAFGCHESMFTEGEG